MDRYSAREIIHIRGALIQGLIKMGYEVTRVKGDYTELTKKDLPHFRVPSMLNIDDDMADRIVIINKFLRGP